MRIAYLVNRYPAVSHSFIRREIIALEARGNVVFRYAINFPDGELVDPADRAEAGKTRHVLRQSPGTILADTARTLFAHPLGILRALLESLSLGHRSDRGIVRHLAYLVEAVVVAAWCGHDGVQHLHAHFGTNSAAVALLASKITGLPYSFTAHGPEEFDKPEAIGLSRKIRSAAFVVAVSSYGRSQLMRWSDEANWKKLHVVHCGIDDESCAGPVGASAPGRGLLCIARLAEQKGLHVLLEATATLRDQGHEFDLVLAGDGPLRESLERRIRDLGLAHLVTMTGWISGERVRAEIERARAFVLPSFAEGLPVVIMEAMALARPVISTYIAGIPELVLPGVTGWLVPPGNPASLAEAMRQALSAAPDELVRMGEAARHRVLERHDVMREAEKLEILMQMAGSHAGSRSRTA
jgi:glycosyltransferase involved in cell wall biosynthesis